MRVKNMYFFLRFLLTKIFEYEFCDMDYSTSARVTQLRVTEVTKNLMAVDHEVF